MYDTGPDNPEEILDSDLEGWFEVTYPLKMKCWSGTEEEQLWETKH